MVLIANQLRVRGSGVQWIKNFLLSRFSRIIIYSHWLMLFLRIKWRTAKARVLFARFRVHSGNRNLGLITNQ